ncbi:heme peroxidase [Mycena rebaudengoi]|nr:heme peroxidase [Mycena rebaudengoi]
MRPFVVFFLSLLFPNSGAIVPFYPWQGTLWHYEESVYLGPYILTSRNNRTETGLSSSIAAEWVRVAYHDMANSDVAAGTGGIDMSIAFELDRPENPGQGLLDALNDFRTIFTPTLNMADSIALGLVLAVAGNGGPIIPFRGGRVDARVAGPPGVPEPTQDIQTHTDMFRRQGFSPTEMIQLVACGHSLGGVRNPDFSDMVPDEGGRKFFDTTQGIFDNNVITEYFDNSTANPLVITQNATFRSDMRIFSSDGNKTMRAMADPNAFASSCGAVFEKMINTVPREVTLTEPIEPAQFWVGRMFTTVLNDNRTKISVTTRWLNPSPNHKVTIFWTDKLNPENCTRDTCSAAAVRVNDQPATSPLIASSLLSAIGIPYRFSKFTFNISTSVIPGKFWFEVEDSAIGDKPFIGDNGGVGFTRGDDLDVFLDLDRTFAATEDDFLVFVAAVRQSNRPSKISVEYVDISAEAAPNFIPNISTLEFAHDPSINATSGYEFWTAKGIPFLFTTFTLTAVRDGKMIVLESEQLLNDLVNIL